MTYEHRILVAVTGMSPQIVTETAWALIHEKHFVPTEIRLITTAHGKNRAVRDLLDPREGRFWSFCRDFGLMGRIRFSEETISVIRNRAGEPLTDIRTPEENAMAADVIVQEIRALCSRDDHQVHVSIAGGRKSMGFFAGYAMSLFARPQDSVSHVLVSEPFEGNRDFFYPNPEPREIFAMDGTPLDTSRARVNLAEIPIVRLRDELPAELLGGAERFSEIVRRAQAHLHAPISLEFDAGGQTILCGGVPVHLPPMLFSIYFWLAKRAAEGVGGVRPEDGHVGEISRIHRDLFPTHYGNLVRMQKTISSGNFLDFFRQKRSDINSKIREALGFRLAGPYLIGAGGERPRTVYSLSLTKEQIRLPGNNS